MTSRNSNEPEVLGSERRRRWSASEKLSMVRETYEPGMTVSLVARQHGVKRRRVALGTHRAIVQDRTGQCHQLAGLALGMPALHRQSHLVP